MTLPDPKAAITAAGGAASDQAAAEAAAEASAAGDRDRSAGYAAERVIWQLSGADVLPFLQGLVSNDVLPLAKAPGIVWAALLTAQGKYLADFFVIRTATAAEDHILIDIAAPLAADTLRRLTMYRLRADVQIQPSPLLPQRGLGPAPEGALPDPRHPALGWRLYSAAPTGEGPAAATGLTEAEWQALRVAHIIPEYPYELLPNETFILEAGFERLHGVDFRKGCYVGQEVTARMKHKTELRKGLTQVAISGTALPGTAITLADGREAGTLATSAGDRALAHVRFDRLAAGGLVAGEARISAIAAEETPNLLPDDTELHRIQ